MARSATPLALYYLGHGVVVCSATIWKAVRLRWVRDHAQAHCPKPSRREAARRWSRSTRSGTSSKKVPKTLDLEGLRARDGPADRLGVRRPRPGHAGPLGQAPGALGRAPVLHRRLRAL